MSKKKFLLVLILLTFTLFSACSDKKDEEINLTNESTTELKICYITFSEIPKDLDLVTNEINKITKEKINATVKFEPIISSEYAQQINLKLNSNENLDLFITGTLSGIFNYLSQASKGQLYPLDGLIKNNGKEVYSALGEEYLNATKVRGKIYGLPTLKDMASGRGINIKKDLIDKYNIDMKNIKNLNDIEELMKLMKEKNPEQYFSATGNTSIVDNLGVSTFGDNLGDGLGVLMNTNDLRVVDYYETEEYKVLLKTIRRWYVSGYIYPDIVTNKESDALLMQMNKLYGSTSNVNPMTQYLQTRNVGSQTVIAEISPAIASTSTVTNFMWAIPSHSKNAEKAMEFLNLMYTDKDIINLLDYGIEGKHYEKVDGFENIINLIPNENDAESGYRLNQEFMFGNEFLAHVLNGNPPDIWGQIDNFNKNAIKSKALGFMFDATPVKTEYAAVSEVVSQYKLALENGAVDPDKVLPDFISKLKTAGIDKIVEEKQRQLDKWAQENK